MQFPHPLLYSLDDVRQNFEFLQGSGLYWGSGAPTFTPSGNAVSFFFRKDAPTVANQRIYIFTGSAWSGIV